MRYSKPDFVPSLESAGLDQTILTAFAHSITEDGLTEAVNTATGLQLSNADVNTYIGERGGLGLIVTGGSIPAPTPRPDRPTGIGHDASAVWCSIAGGTTEGTIVRWYVNGAPVVDKTGVYANSATLVELGAGAGDTVQIAEVEDDVVGWWGKIEIGG